MSEGKNGLPFDDEFKSFQEFQERMQGIDDILKARQAVATILYVEEYLRTLRDQNINEIKIEETQTKIVQYRSNLDSKFDFPPMNEVTIVLLSAYLEAFIEDLHGEAIHELVRERARSSGVVEALIKNAHDQFSNPKEDKITKLFNTCCIEKIVVKLSKRYPEITQAKIDRFVTIRNHVAHGEHVSVSYQELLDWIIFVRRFAGGLFQAVQDEVNFRNSKSI